MRIGDAIASVATPIARTLGLPCVDPSTHQLRPESGCAKRKAMLNSGQYGAAFYDLFWSTNSKIEHTMEYIVTKQIAVQAENIEEAVSKVSEGQTIGLSVHLRQTVQLNESTQRPEKATR
jgi:hypothetical protein